MLVPLVPQASLPTDIPHIAPVSREWDNLGYVGVAAQSVERGQFVAVVMGGRTTVQFQIWPRTPECIS